MMNLAPLQPGRIPLVAQPVERCAWCWPALHPREQYPEAWSSTICSAHDAWMMAQLAARRARREQEARPRS